MASLFAKSIFCRSVVKNKINKTNNNGHSVEISDRFDKIIGLVERTIKAARRIMNGLRPELLELNGLVSTAATYIHEFEDRYQINCEFLPDKEIMHQKGKPSSR